MQAGNSNKIKTYNQMYWCSIYLTKVIIHRVQKRSPYFILWRLQNIVEKYVYRIKVELRAWRIMISLKFDNVFVPLQRACIIKTTPA
jgi:hypothetical protein